MEHAHYLIKIKHVLQKIHHKYYELFVALGTSIFYLKFCYIFPKCFFFMQLKLELFSPEIVSALKNKELLSGFRVHKKVQQVQKRTDA